jgi:outer membrane immunogenic protein
MQGCPTELKNQGAKMKRMSLVAMATVGFSVPTFAADIPFARPFVPSVVAAAYDWSGFYIGANGGWSGDSKCWGLTNNGAPIAPTANVGCSRGSGGVAGGQIGYRWQADAFVFGLEAQGDWANLKGSSPSLINGLVTNQSQVNAFGLFTGQAGYAWNNALLYVRGGAAVASDKYSGLGTATGIVFDQASEKLWGGAVGAGVEFGFSPNWSASVGYDHLFMGRASNTFISTGLGPNNMVPAGGLERIVNIRQDVDMVTAHINYRWGNPAAPRF